MRPALAALYQQQQLIDQLRAENGQLRAHAAKNDRQIAQLTRGLSALSKLTGLDTQVRTAIFKRADEQNPAQPVPEPAGVAPTQTNADAETPEAKADVRAPGLVPGTNADTAADAVTTTYTPGMDLPSPAVRNLQDVTAPIEGTQGPRPLNETKTLVDVRVGDPMNAQVAYPVNGPFSNAQRTSSQGDSRAVAAIRLAKLRIATGTAENDDELYVMDSIVRDASLSDDAIAREIGTLDKVYKSAAKKAIPSNLVPRPASVQRTVPSLTSKTAAASDEDDAEMLFLGDL